MEGVEGNLMLFERNIQASSQGFLVLREEAGSSRIQGSSSDSSGNNLDWGMVVLRPSEPLPD